MCGPAITPSTEHSQFERLFMLMRCRERGRLLRTSQSYPCYCRLTWATSPRVTARLTLRVDNVLQPRRRCPGALAHRRGPHLMTLELLATCSSAQPTSSVHGSSSDELVAGARYRIGQIKTTEHGYPLGDLRKFSARSRASERIRKPSNTVLLEDRKLMNFLSDNFDRRD